MLLTAFRCLIFSQIYLKTKIKSIFYIQFILNQDFYSDRYQEDSKFVCVRNITLAFHPSNSEMLLKWPFLQKRVNNKISNFYIHSALLYKMQPKLTQFSVVISVMPQMNILQVFRISVQRITVLQEALLVQIYSTHTTKQPCGSYNTDTVKSNAILSHQLHIIKQNVILKNHVTLLGHFVMH